MGKVFYNIRGKKTTKMMCVWKEWLKDKQTKFGIFKNLAKKVYNLFGKVFVSLNCSCTIALRQVYEFSSNNLF